jgi:hypothetical protein
MKSGNHTHYCPTCKSWILCPQITHCTRPEESECTSCMDYKFVQDEPEGYEPDDPKHPRWWR